MWNHTTTDGKTRRPATALFLLCLLLGLAAVARFSSSNSALHLLFPSGEPAMLGAFAAAAALVQWLLLRNEILEIAVWLPTVFSAAGILAGEAAHAVPGGFDALWLVWLGAPLYAGSAVVLLLAWLLPFRRE